MKKFDFVIGNPPYQDKAGGTSTSDNPIYHTFMESAFSIAPKVCLITPARFLFNAGKTPRNRNKKMLEDEHFKVIYYYPKSSILFPNTNIMGGIAISYRDKYKIYNTIGTFTSHSELSSIREKVVNHISFKDITPIINTQNKFDLGTLYKDHPNYKTIIGSNGKDRRLRQSIMERLPEIFITKKKCIDMYKILGLIDRKRTYRYILKKYIEDNGVIEKYKVFVPTANGSSSIGEDSKTPIIGEPLIGDKLVGITQTFISFGGFDEKLEAQNCLKYIKTKFSRTLLGILKITQSNNKETWINVPIQDFTERGDINWEESIEEIDQQLYKKYNLSKKEIIFIEKNIKEMK